MQSRYLDIGIRVHVLQFGPQGIAAPPVLLIHGMVVASNGTLPLGRALARAGLQVWVPDLPGFGRSDKPRHALDVDALADAAAATARAAGLAEPSVLGNSFGTQVAAAMAARHPDLVSRLVLLSPTVDPRLRGRWASRLPPGRIGGPPRRGLPGRLHEAVRDRVVPVPSESDSRSLGSLIRREYVAAGPARALSTVRHAMRDDIGRRMPAIGVPTLVVRAELDRFVSPDWAGAVAAMARLGSVVDIPGVDHDSQFHAPDRVVAAVGDFLGAPGEVPTPEGQERVTDTAGPPTPGLRPSTKRPKSSKVSGAGSGSRGRVDRSESR